MFINNYLYINVTTKGLKKVAGRGNDDDASFNPSLHVKRKKNIVLTEQSVEGADHLLIKGASAEIGKDLLGLSIALKQSREPLSV